MKKSFDICIVGGGLSGLLCAKALTKADPTLKVALIESNPNLGGSIKGHSSPHGTLGFGFKFFPKNEDSLAALAFLSETLDTPIDLITNESTPVTFDKGELQPYVGFGENAPKEIDEISYYTQTPRLFVNPPVHAWLELMTSRPSFEIFLKSHVTEFLVQNNRVRGVKINGDKILEATHFIFASHPHHLLDIFPNDLLPPKLVQKISRTNPWTTISLDLVHGVSISHEKGLFVLRGAGDTTLTCLGQFNSPTHSQWLAFLDEDLSSEEESAGALREIKRQLKRVFPKALEGLLFERILVAPKSHGYYSMKDEKGLNIAGIENLWLASGQLEDSKNIIGTLLRAQKISRQVLSLKNIVKSPEIQA